MGWHATGHMDQQEAPLRLYKFFNLDQDARFGSVVNPPPQVMSVEEAHTLDGLATGPFPVRDPQEDRSSTRVRQADDRLANLSHEGIKGSGRDIPGLAFQRFRFDRVRRFPVQAAEKRADLSRAMHSPNNTTFL